VHNHHRVIGGAYFALVAFAISGCAASTGGVQGNPPASDLPAVDRETGYTGIVSGAADSAGWQSGSETAKYRYRFRQISPGSSSFTFRDRELSFYFRPSTDALHFQVENLTDRPIWIDWDRSTFFVPRAGSDRVAHGSTRWVDRNSALAPTQITGLQRYGDYVFPMSYLVDSGGREEQLHRRLLPEDDSAIHFNDAEFGVELVFNIDERPRNYTFRFKVASVLPN
jgi:hypothetical protein